MPQGTPTGIPAGTAGEFAGGKSGGGVARLLREPRKDAWGRLGVGTLGRPGVLPSCGTAGAARPAWCRLGMVPPIGGAVHGGTVLPGGNGAGLHGTCNWRRGSLAARFPSGAVPGTARGRERGHVKKQSVGLDDPGGRPGALLGALSGALLGALSGALLGAASGERGRRNGVWGCGAGGNGAVSGGTVRWNGVWGCGVGVRGMGKESRSRGRVSQ